VLVVEGVDNRTLLPGSADDQTMKERRALERFKLRLPAKIQILSGSQGAERTVLKLFTSNICSGGAFFPFSNPPLQGTTVKVNLLLDYARLKLPTVSCSLVEVKGTVLRSEPFGMAVAFEPDYRITPQTKARVVSSLRLV
jgi:hypothetical protein